VRLALDHHYSPQIALTLRARAHDAIAIREREWETMDDETLLVSCYGEQRALMTNNVGDFTEIARRWTVEGRQHYGLVFTSDASMPRSRDTIGRFVDALSELLKDNAHLRAFVDRIHWL